MPRSLLNLDAGDSGNLQFQPTPRADGKRIVHIGLGAFARAHIAVLTQIANIEANEGWRISGVVRNNQLLKEALARQDHKYTVYDIAEQPRGRVIDCVDEVLSWQQDYASIIKRLTEAETKLVTITVTEKGYCLDHRGGLNVDDEDIKRDLKRRFMDLSSSTPPATTLPGMLCDAAWQRMQKGMPSLTIISCDNLSSNGKSLKGALLEFAALADEQLGSWMEQHLHCPNTVVDCIVPRVTAEQVQRVQSTLDIDDEVPVLCEPFRQWVIASKELEDSPAWALAGAELVEDSKLYEEQKLRILNASHSALAYLGLLQGCRWVSDAMARKNIRKQLNSLMEEIFQSFADQTSARRYFGKVVERFENPAMQHALTQIGSDGSNKIPLRWAPSILINQHNGRELPGFANVIAAWLACWHLLPDEKIRGMTDPAEKNIKLLAEQLSQSQTDTDLWQKLLGVEPNAIVKQQTLAAFSKLAQQAASPA